MCAVSMVIFRVREVSNKVPTVDDTLLFVLTPETCVPCVGETSCTGPELVMSGSSGKENRLDSEAY